MCGLTKRVREEMAINRRMGEIDDQLIDALFQPAIDDGLSEGGTELFWRDPKCRSEASSFKTGLLYMSEFYVERNPVLSSALWGIWNTIQYTEQDFAGLSRKRQKADFIRYKALTATAIMHFANGDAYTQVTSDAARNRIDWNELYAAKAMKEMQEVGDMIQEDSPYHAETLRLAQRMDRHRR